ncbi:endopeptidase La [Saccharospirillum sp. MSK14-1]|uniref:endopeptidase La n=1 Tax=Saccharospirillum sp. MSK14-1 TaxID=1897632 RepID=UPI000D379D69|nr:endopeptidase La [Saccharospirillum sp. MSK14-1]PTY36880.1 endopeptidase La [Saccharospirillum sp. MSK14-1]
MTDQDPHQPEIISRGSALVPSDEQLPDKLYLIPVQNRPYFPAQIMPIMVQADAWRETLERVSNTPHKLLCLFHLDDFEAHSIRRDQLPLTGTVVRVHQVRERDGAIHFIAEGLRRVQMRSWLSRKPPYLMEVAYPTEPQESESEVRAYAMALIGAIKELLPINPLYSEELKQYLNRFSPNQPSPLADFAAAITSADTDALQDVLDTLPLLARMERVLALLKRELEVARLHQEINDQVNQEMSEHQREFFLREQLKYIQKELGISKDDRQSDADEFRQRLEDKTVPPEAMKRIDEELHKLSMLETGSPEYGVTRNYLDWATQIPWGHYSEDKLDLQRARKVLDKHHSGLEDVKERILEFLAVGAYKGEIAGSIVLLVGPPGVGKTSIGRAVADSLGRPFYRFSLGGMRDEAEIKGHRRTYIGAMPGKFVQALKDVDVMNPVIMLDEIDKIGASYQGDPASALLETLDPEQNSQFLDHYLDLRLDLSKVLFVCTANQLDTIPPALLDRMDVIRLSGYLAEEKLDIASRHLWPRQLERAGVDKKQLKISRKALRQVIEGYAREAGVRNLEKQLAKIIRKSVVRLLEAPDSAIQVQPEDLPGLLGTPVFRHEKRLKGVGVVTGLAWTSMGGATLPIEVTRVHDYQRGLKLTGKLGDVMRESAEIAYSFVVANAQRYGGNAELFKQSLIHVHVPEGATPKDGPSAGVTLSTALLSLALNKAPPAGLAMTGEITLTGEVLAVGGIREKVIAARRQGIRKLILPEPNRGDFDELPAYLKKGLTVTFADHFDQVVQGVFG